MSGVLVCFGLLIMVCVVTWAVSVRSGSAAWLDRLWSITPVVYAWVIAGSVGFVDTRVNLLAVLVTLWGVRLTFSYARKGGYGRGVQDYRWAIVRAGMSAGGWRAFHALFISGYQQLLLLLIVLPLGVAAEYSTPVGWVDWVLAAVFLLLLVGEGVADGQQWRFQQAKRARLDAGEPMGDGFVSSGLFRLSRHPHFLCELLMWWVVYLLGAVGAGRVLDWSILGTVLLTAQIVGSTWMMESLSRAKYPAYEAYQSVTSRLALWPPKPPVRQ